ncbi:MAG: peptidase S24, partial [Saprospiraceae bacterium]|nr:peptidase S24 [Saprospiraceae bacterium]
MASIVTHRFIQCHDLLKEQGRVKSSRQFALSLDYFPQNLSDILKGKRDVPLDVIRKAVERFRINPLYLYSGEGAMFLDEKGDDSFRVLTVVTDNNGDEKITHVPIPAQAGYASDHIDPVLLKELPAYHIPGMYLHQGTFRSFDVSGDSMQPHLDHNDKVVCNFIEPADWISGVKDGHVYVIVTR